MSFFDVIDSVAAARGAAPCWIVPGRGTWSYADLRAGVERFALALHRLGVEPGDRVLAQVEKSPEALLVYLACLRLGAIYVPLNTAYTSAELEYFIGDATPRVVVCDPARESLVSTLAARHPDTRVTTLDARGGGALASLAASESGSAPRGSHDVAAILYTSGTTGRSKGAMLSHANLLSNASTLVEQWEFTSDDVLLHALPIFHIHGLFVAVHCALLSGAATVLLPKFDPKLVCEHLAGASVLMGVPTFYVRLLLEPGFTRELAAGRRLFISGSAPLLAATSEAFEQRTGHRILERYGMSEAGMIASNPYRGERVAGTVGFALPGVEARIADSTGAELPRGTAGVLEIRGPNVFRGYWRLPERTAAEFRPDGFFITGDVATMAADGRISIVGRAKDLIISGGFNVYPKEIERELDALDGVAESAVIGVPHPDFGEAVVAVVVARGTVPTEEALVASLRDRLARFKQPKRVFFVPELPRNAMGKVQKNLLRESYRGTFAPS